MVNNTKTNSRFKQTALVSALLLELTNVQAATISVNGTTCKFADAVVAANNNVATGGCSAGSGDDVIELTSPVINVSAQATIKSNITINGNGNTLQSNGSDFMMLSVSDYNKVTPGHLTINDTTVQNGFNSNNWGAGVRVYSGSLHINRSTFRNNTGGAVIFSPGTSGSIVQSVITDNNGANGNWYSAAITIAGSVVTIEGSTISHNNTNSVNSGGGALYIIGYQSPLYLTLTNTTISGNSSIKNGGGISHDDSAFGATVVLNNVTLVNNTTQGNGGGFYNESANVTINQSLIANNTGTGGREIHSIGGTVTVNNYNLFGLNGNAGMVGVNVGASDNVPTVSHLADIIDVNLVNNGGLTPTHNLNPGGPAVDVIANGLCLLNMDQRGKARPIDGNGDGTAECDVGALEYSPDVIFKDGFDDSDVIFKNGFD